MLDTGYEEINFESGSSYIEPSPIKLNFFAFAPIIRYYFITAVSGFSIGGGIGESFYFYYFEGGDSLTFIDLVQQFFLAYKFVGKNGGLFFEPYLGANIFLLGGNISIFFSAKLGFAF